MKAEIFRHKINRFIEFYDESGQHMDYCEEWIFRFDENSLKRAIKRVKW